MRFSARYSLDGERRITHFESKAPEICGRTDDGDLTIYLSQ